MTRLTRRKVLGLGALAGATLATRPAVAAAPVNLRKGVNVWPWFSLTREYPAPRTDYAWPPFQPQRPVPSAADLSRLARAGFDFIRIPVDPGPFLAFEATQRGSLVDDLMRAVGMAIEAGLSVVLNLQPNAATHFWTPERMVGDLSAPAFPAFRGLVAVVAGALQRFDLSRVALEPVNEPPHDCASAAWDKVQFSLLAAARRAAPSLTLVATGGCGSMVRGLLGLDPAPLKVFEPVLFTFHFYEPYLFTHQGAPWMREPIYRYLNGVPWPGRPGTLEATLAAVRQRMAQDVATPAEMKEAAYAATLAPLKQYFDANPDIRFIQGYFAQVRDWGARHAVATNRVLLGEFGALRTDNRYVAAAAPDRARYIRDVRETAEALGAPWAYWNLFDGFALMDEASRTFDPAIAAALGVGGGER